MATKNQNNRSELKHSVTDIFKSFLNFRWAAYLAEHQQDLPHGFKPKEQTNQQMKISKTPTNRH